MASQETKTDKNNDEHRINAIEVKGVSKGFGKKLVLSKVDFGIKRGQVFGIIGMSGAGKTTLLELIVGFLKPDDGDILFTPQHLLVPKKDEAIYKSVFREQNSVKQTFGFATQTPSFYEDLTVEENLRYFGSLYGLSKEIIKTNIETSLSLVGLSEEKKSLARSLSGGMQKRLDIACAMIHDPPVLILDEPTADLDILLRKQMWDLVKRINAKGTTVIISSHFLDELENLCDEIAILVDRKIRFTGTLAKLNQKYSTSEEITLKTSPGRYDLLLKNLKKEKIRDIVRRDGSIVIYADDAEPVMHRILHLLEDTKEEIIDLELRKPTLEEVFEEIVKKSNE